MGTYAWKVGRFIIKWETSKNEKLYFAHFGKYDMGFTPFELNKKVFKTEAMVKQAEALAKKIMYMGSPVYNVERQEVK